MFARLFSYTKRFFRYLSTLHLQGYVNAAIVGIGLLANLIALGQFFGLVYTPPTNSNFYVNSREYLAWVLLIIVYSIGLINAYIRRRWRRLYGDTRADHSVLNLFAKTESAVFLEEQKTAKLRFRNFQRDFSFLYIAMLGITFLFSRAVTATNSSTGITPAPWGDLLITAVINVPFTLVMMIITSMFDFAMSIFWGDQNPELN